MSTEGFLALLRSFLALLRSFLALSLGTVHRTWLSRRFLLLTVTTAVLLLLGGLRLGLLAAEAVNPAPGSSPVWELGADGAVVGFAFAFVPFFLPLLPIGIASEVRTGEVRLGVLETAMSRRSPHWLVALAGFFGLFVATAVAVVVIVGATVLVIMGTAGSEVSGGFVGPLLSASLLLTALYLALGLLLATRFDSGTTLGILFLAWLAFNAVRSTSADLSAQMLLIVPVASGHTFVSGWGDLLSFTGLYEAAIAPFVPAGLRFTVVPGLADFGGRIGMEVATFSALPILLLVIVAYIRFATRHPIAV